MILGSFARRAIQWLPGGGAMRRVNGMGAPAPALAVGLGQLKGAGLADFVILAGFKVWFLTPAGIARRPELLGAPRPAGL